jgi:hypothetical protein
MSTATQVSGGRRVKQATIAAGRKVLVYDMPGDAELHEEYDVITDELLVRKLRKRTAVGVYGAWDVEIGAPPGGFVPEKDLIKEASTAPVVSRKDTAESVQFRIRNLQLGPDVTVAVAVEAADPNTIVVRTSNRKYFKKLQVPELVRAGLPLENAALTTEVERGTLIISYRKPLFLLAQENEDRKMRSAMRFSRADDPKGADCAQQ